MDQRDPKNQTTAKVPATQRLRSERIKATRIRSLTHSHHSNNNQIKPIDRRKGSLDPKSTTKQHPQTSPMPGVSTSSLLYWKPIACSMAPSSIPHLALYPSEMRRLFRLENFFGLVSSLRFLVHGLGLPYSLLFERYGGDCVECCYFWVFVLVLVLVLVMVMV